jgi:hypothetical protein
MTATWTVREAGNVSTQTQTRSGVQGQDRIGRPAPGGSYSSYQADLIVRMPKKKLQAVLIKQQRNVASNGKDYLLRLPRIMHEYVILWQRRRTVMVAPWPNVVPVP